MAPCKEAMRGFWWVSLFEGFSYCVMWMVKIENLAPPLPTTPRGENFASKVCSQLDNPDSSFWRFWLINGADRGAHGLWARISLHLTEVDMLGHFLLIL